MSAQLFGELEIWPSMDHMAAILRAAGLRIVVGKFSIRVEDCSHFVFQEYGLDLRVPQIDADADTSDEMMRDGRLISDALARARIRHRFEVYDEDDPDAIAGYLHHEWPLNSAPPNPDAL